MPIGNQESYRGPARANRPRGQSPGSGVLWMPEEIEAALKRARESGDLLPGELEEGLERLNRTRRRPLFSQYLAEWRCRMGMSHEGAARYLKMPKQTYQNAEWGNCHFGDEVVKRIAVLMRVEPQWLLEFSHQSKAEYQSRRVRKAARKESGEVRVVRKKEPLFNVKGYFSEEVMSWLEARAELHQQRTGRDRPSLSAVLQAIVHEKYAEDLKKPDSPVWEL